MLWNTEGCETRSAEFLNTTATFQSRSWNLEPLKSYWSIFFSKWCDGLFEISDLGTAGDVLGTIQSALVLGDARETHMQDFLSTPFEQKGVCDEMVRR